MHTNGMDQAIDNTTARRVGAAIAGHTPGPWSTGLMRKGAAGYPEQTVHVGELGLNGGQGNPLATVYLGGPGATSDSPEAISANARLIAAAPDLLAACKLAEQAIANHGRIVGPMGLAIDSLRAAIAKAVRP